MLNYIWFGMLVFGFITGIVNGRIGEVSGAVLEYAGKAVEVSIGLLGVMCLWSGLMRVAERSGLVGFLSRKAAPVLRHLFPDISKGHPAMASIVMNMAANFLGLGNAATPLGLKAMSDLQKLNRNPSQATDAMCMFLVLNTAAVQLIPTTIIAVRTAAGAQNPSDIICTIWPASLCTLLCGIIAARVFSALDNRRNASNNRTKGCGKKNGNH